MRNDERSIGKAVRVDHVSEMAIIWQMLSSVADSMKLCAMTKEASGGQKSHLPRCLMTLSCLCLCAVMLVTLMIPQRHHLKEFQLRFGEHLQLDYYRSPASYGKGVHLINLISLHHCFFGSNLVEFARLAVLAFDD